MSYTLEKIRSLFLLLISISIAFGLVLKETSPFNMISNALINSIGVVGLSALLTYMVGLSISIYREKEFGNRWFGAIGFFFLLCALKSGTIGEGVFYFSYIFIESKTLTLTALTFISSLFFFFDYKVIVYENKVRKLDTPDEEEDLYSLPEPLKNVPEYTGYSELLKKVLVECRTSKYPLPKREIQPRKDDQSKSYKNYTLPPTSLLKPALKSSNTSEDKSSDLVYILRKFKIDVRVHEVSTGPTFTSYLLKVPEGTKYNRIISLKNEMMGALKARSIRIQAPIPGTEFVGIEIPNEDRQSVSFSEGIYSIKETDHPLTCTLGKSNDGSFTNCNLAKMPHLLIAGTTGSGKSVCLNSIIGSLLMKNTPDTLKLALIDPKRSEFVSYEGLPHLWSPVIYNDTDKAVSLLENLVNEMETRYEILANSNCKDIKSYNKKNRSRKMPYIVIVVEEFADLMMAFGKKDNMFEKSLCRITQKARACGIHSIIATQRPSANVVSGLIKSNFPSSIACKVRSHIDSKIILDETGAETLMGNGDMLFRDSQSVSSIRLQGVFIEDSEIENIVKYYKEV
jgi:S-DNA-T family DNA segregation ATPase FtsK/SpoIIIE